MTIHAAIAETRSTPTNMQKAGIATPHDFARWDAAWTRYVAQPGDKAFFAPIFSVIARRPQKH